MPNSKRGARRIIDVRIVGPTLRIAFAQTDGPLPAGKVNAVTAEGRESFAWASMQEVTRRIEKACAIIEFIMQEHPETNIVIFPEYTIPIEIALPRLHDLANAHNLIIIPGADNIMQEERGIILNQAPVILPHKEAPVWVTKQNLSQWEEGKIDRPNTITAPFFRWTSEGRSFYFTVNICLDFPMVIRDTAPTGDDPVVHLVPMCSPDTTTFLTYADTVLWEPGGRAVVLCNCVGAGAAGGSALFAVTPAGGRLRPVLSLSSNKEGIAYTEIRCDRLVPPRRSGKEPLVSIGQVFSYDLEISSAGMHILPSTDREEDLDVLERAVLNPALFGYLGKQLRITFLGVEGYGSFDKAKLSARNFELYSVLGHDDVMVTHLHHNAYALIYDVEKSFVWKLSTGLRGDRRGEPLDEHAIQLFPYFEVKGYHKVLGVSVPSETANAFYIHPPAQADIERLIAIGMDWATDAVDGSFRETALRKKWILATTKREPGAIDAVMTIYMDHPAEIQGPLATFDRLVLPQLVENPTVTSVFSGTGHRVNIHYILRISAPGERLFSFIQEVHRTAETAGLVMASTTYVIVRKWSRLSIRDALMLPRLPADRERFLYFRILPRIGPDLMAQLISWPAEKQMELLATLERVLLSWDHLEWESFPRDKDEVEKELMAGLVRNSPSMLGEVCSLLLGHVEDAVGKLIKEQLPSEEFERVKQAAEVQSHKDADHLLLAEKLKILRVIWQEGRIIPQAAPLDPVFDERLNRVRNAITHREFGRVAIEEVVETIERCSTVLAWWAQGTP